MTEPEFKPKFSEFFSLLGRKDFLENTFPTSFAHLERKKSPLWEKQMAFSLFLEENPTPRIIGQKPRGILK